MIRRIIISPILKSLELGTRPAAREVLCLKSLSRKTSCRFLSKGLIQNKIEHLTSPQDSELSNHFIREVKEALTFHEVLSSVLRNKKIITPDQLNVICNDLSLRVLKGKDNPNNLTCDPSFDQFCDIILRNLLHLNEAGVINILKFLVTFKIPVESYIGQHVWKLLCDDVNTWSMLEAMFVNSLLMKVPKTHKVIALQTAITHLVKVDYKTRLNTSNINELLRVATFSSNIPILNNVADFCWDQIKGVKEEIWSTLDAVNVYQIAKLALLREDPSSEDIQIFSKAIDLLKPKIDQLNLNAIHFLHCTSCERSLKFKGFYNKELVYLCEEQIMLHENPLRQLIFSIKAAQTAGHFNYSFLDHLINLVFKKLPEVPVIDFMFFIMMASAYCHTFDKRDQELIKDKVEKELSEIFSRGSLVVWFTSSLLNVGVFVHPLTEKVLERTWKELVFSNVGAFYKVKQVLMINQKASLNPDYNGPLFRPRDIRDIIVRRSDIKDSFEPVFPLISVMKQITMSRFLANVYTEYGYLIDYVVAVESTSPLIFTSFSEEELEGKNNFFLKNIRVEKSTLCLIMEIGFNEYQGMRRCQLDPDCFFIIKELEKEGYKVIPLIQKKFFELLPSEIPSFIERMILEKFERNISEKNC